MKRWLFGILVLMQVVATEAAIESHTFISPQQEQEYQTLTQQLRCPKCQNNSIADSNSIIAEDMRQKVYELIMQGQNKQQIIDYMVARYGHFVSYDPPLTPATLILWLGPLLFILIGIIVILYYGRKKDNDALTLTKEEQQRLTKLLNDKNRNIS